MLPPAMTRQDILCKGHPDHLDYQPDYPIERIREVARWVLANVRGRITWLQEEAAELHTGSVLDITEADDERMHRLMLEFDHQVPS